MENIGLRAVRDPDEKEMIPYIYKDILTGETIDMDMIKKQVSGNESKEVIFADDWLPKDHKPVLSDLLEIINQDCYRIRDGVIVWRSGMDAGGPPPPFLGKTITGLLEEWAIEYGYEV